MKIAVHLAAACAAFLVAALPAHAEPAKAPDKPAKEEAKPAEGSQQNRMKACNAEASKKELKGDERRAFMSRCLKN